MFIWEEAFRENKKIITEGVDKNFYGPPPRLEYNR
jgi:hypothetical protein